MKIKKFVAESMPEAMSLVKKEMGVDAVILYTKNVKKKSIIKWFKKDAIEVVAALDYPEEDHVPSGMKENAKGSELEQLFRPSDLNNNMSGPTVDFVPFGKQTKQESVDWTNTMPEKVKTIYQGLIDEGIWQANADRLIQGLLKKWYTSEEPVTNEAMKKTFYNAILSELEDIEFSGLGDSYKVINLLGPTGVGKTTTAAKLASKAALDHGKSVAFITTDTYRIAAVEQLKTYAKILDVPVAVAYSSADFEQALMNFKDKDLIIVDSAGRNYQQKKYVDELTSLIPFDHNMQNFLVLSATAKAIDLNRITKQFDSLSISKFIFTKVDETTSIGPLFNLLFEKRLGVAYMTNGQNVPDDLVLAEKDALIRQLIEGVFRG